LERVECNTSLAVEVEHGGRETMRQRFSESPDGAEAPRLRQMPRGTLRGSLHDGRCADGLTRPERAPHDQARWVRMASSRSVRAARSR